MLIGAFPVWTKKAQFSILRNTKELRYSLN